MRKYIIIFLMLLMAALPVWSATVLCQHVPGEPVQKVMAADHHCCLDKHQAASAADVQTAADSCHCDQFQHAQFVLSLPDTLAAAPTSRFPPPVLPLRTLPERVDLLYRPPIA